MVDRFICLSFRRDLLRCYNDNNSIEKLNKVMKFYSVLNIRFIPVKHIERSYN